MAFWLLKTEPEEYSWEDLSRDKEAVWDGVKAPAAIGNIRRMQPGDLAFIYHTGKERRIVGIGEITTLPYTDPQNNGLEFKIVPKQKLPNAITLAKIKESGMFAEWELVRLPRLSVMPVSEAQWESIVRWAAE